MESHTLRESLERSIVQIGLENGRDSRVGGGEGFLSQRQLDGPRLRIPLVFESGRDECLARPIESVLKSHRTRASYWNDRSVKSDRERPSRDENTMKIATRKCAGVRADSERVQRRLRRRRRQTGGAPMFRESGSSRSVKKK